MIRKNEVRSSAYTTTFYTTSSIQDVKSAVKWFHHVLSLDCFEDIYTVHVGQEWTNDFDSTGAKFSPESATVSGLMECVEKTSPGFIEVPVNYEGDRFIVGVDLIHSLAYVTIRTKDLSELPWIVKILPE